MSGRTWRRRSLVRLARFLAAEVGCNRRTALHWLESPAKCTPVADYAFRRAMELLHLPPLHPVYGDDADRAPIETACLNGKRDYPEWLRQQRREMRGTYRIVFDDDDDDDSEDSDGDD